jgi:hypothetical protein
MALFGKGKQKTDDNDPTLLCMVLSRSSAPPANKQVVKSLIREFGDRARVVESKGGVWMLELGDTVNAFLSYIPAPIPEQEAELAAAGNILWPNGDKEVAKHRSHIITGIPGCQSDQPAAMLTLSRLAGCVLNTFNGIGVYWGSGHVVNSRTTFLEILEQSSTDHLPLNLWIRFQLFENDDKTIGLYTLGMEQFGLMNLEVDACSWQLMKLYEFLFDIAHYLVDNGPVLNDGDTVGGDEFEPIRVTFAASMHNKKTKVYKILFEK